MATSKRILQFKKGFVKKNMNQSDKGIAATPENLRTDKPRPAPTQTVAPSPAKAQHSQMIRKGAKDDAPEKFPKYMTTHQAPPKFTSTGAPLEKRTVPQVLPTKFEEPKPVPGAPTTAVQTATTVVPPQAATTVVPAETVTTVAPEPKPAVSVTQPTLEAVITTEATAVIEPAATSTDVTFTGEAKEEPKPAERPAPAPPAVPVPNTYDAIMALDRNGLRAKCVELGVKYQIRWNKPPLRSAIFEKLGIPYTPPAATAKTPPAE